MYNNTKKIPSIIIILNSFRKGNQVYIFQGLTSFKFYYVYAYVAHRGFGHKTK